MVMSDEKRTDSGIEVKALYDPADLDDWDPAERLGEPGSPPYTRGVYPTMYRGKLWTMRQYAGFGTAKSTNERFKFLLGAGQTGLSCAFDLPTQMGYDSDHPRAEGEVGKVGVAIDSIADMRMLLADMPLDTASMSMTINSTGAILLLLYELVAEEQGVPATAISGTIQNDILKEYIARGTYVYPPRPSMRIITDIFEYCATDVPQVEHDLDLRLPHPRGRKHGGAGDRVHHRQRHRLRRGGARRRAWTSTRSHRASASSGTRTTTSSKRSPSSAPLARIWYRLMNERFGAKKESSKLLAVPHPDRRLDADRAAAGEQRRARRRAVDGGGDGWHAEPAHEWLTTRRSACHRSRPRRSRCARSRSSATRAASPTRPIRWPASYFVESLTDEVERLAWEYIDRIDEMGGAVDGIEAGFQQDEIEQAAYEYAKSIDDDERVIVGAQQVHGRHRRRPGHLPRRS